MWRNMLVILVICFVQAVPTEAKNEAPTNKQKWEGKFAAERQEGTIKVFFTIRNPGASYQGMVVKYRTTEGQTWKGINSTPLFPRPIAKIDWASLDPDQEQQKRLKAKAMALKAAGKEKLWPVFADSKKMAQQFADKAKRRKLFTTPYSWYFGSRDFDYLLIYGCACIARNTDPEVDYELGLFPVFHGKISDEPVARFQVPASEEKGELPVQNLQIEWSDDDERFELQWDIADSYCFANGFSSVAVYRALDEKPIRFHKIGEGFNSGGEHFTKNNLRWFGLQDRAKPVADPRKNYVFRFVPRNYFFRELKQTYTFTYPQKPEKKK